MSRTIIRNITVSDDPILAANEMGYDSINKVLKIGNGTSKWSQLSAIQTGGADEMSTIIKGTATIQSDTVLTIDDFNCATMPKVAYIYLGTGQSATSTTTTIKPISIMYIGEEVITESCNSSGNAQISSMSIAITNNHLTFTSTNALGFNTSDLYNYILVY